MIKTKPWQPEERLFLKENAHLGVTWLSENVHTVCGNPRSESAIQRIAGHHGYSIKKQNQGNGKAPRKPALKKKSVDEEAQENVKRIQAIAWPI